MSAVWGLCLILPSLFLSFENILSKRGPVAYAKPAKVDIYTQNGEKERISQYEGFLYNCHAQGHLFICYAIVTVELSHIALNRIIWT